MGKTALVFLLAGNMGIIGCMYYPDHRTESQRRGRYAQSLKTPVALLVRERNGAPMIMASAFLIDKQRGLFASAEHFVGKQSDGDCKIFFNGLVYQGFLVQVPAITDLVVVKIDGRFNASSFPEPFRLAKQVREGERVFVRGIHPHPQSLRQGKTVIPIFQQYYGVIQEDEFVFDDLGATVVDTRYQIKNGEIRGSSEALEAVTNIFIKLRTEEDHFFSFAGLSGGPVVNEHGELVGVTAVEEGAHLEVTSEGVKYVPWVTISLVPVEELIQLISHLSRIN